MSTEKDRSLTREIAKYLGSKTENGLLDRLFGRDKESPFKTDRQMPDPFLPLKMGDDLQDAYNKWLIDQTVKAPAPVEPHDPFDLTLTETDRWLTGERVWVVSHNCGTYDPSLTDKPHHLYANALRVSGGTRVNITDMYNPQGHFLGKIMISRAEDFDKIEKIQCSKCRQMIESVHIRAAYFKLQTKGL